MAARPVKHTRLNRSPLKRVVCQVRFPTVLGFDAARVRPLQQALEDEYPLVTTEKVVFGVILGAVPSPTHVELKDVFRFSVVEGHTRVGISEDFIALETVRYDRFADFSQRWEHLMRISVEMLGIRRQARLGLRFINVIEREGHDEGETADSWAGLIRDHLLTSMRGTTRLLSATAQLTQQTMLLTTDVGKVTFRHGCPPPPEENLPAAGYLIDIDTFDDRPTVIDFEQDQKRLATWDHQSYQLLRGSVTTKLWASFEPEDEQ